MSETRRPAGLVAAVLVLAMVLSLVPSGSFAEAASPGIVISQVYGGGGNSGAQWKNDFVELYNRGTAAVSVTDWSVQYTSATGPGNFSGSVTVLSGTILPGQYYLVKQSAGTGGTLDLPTSDATGSATMAAGAGKVALVSSKSGVACNGGTTPCTAAQLASIVDLVGYGNATFYEGSAAAPTLSNTTAAMRKGGGCTDTDNNGADFAAVTPVPRNSATTAHDCRWTDLAAVAAANPAAGLFAGSSSLLTVAVTPGTFPTSTGVAVSANLTAVGGATAQVLHDDGLTGDVTAGDNVFSFALVLPAGVSGGNKTIPIAVTDLQGRAITLPLSITCLGPTAPAGSASAQPSTVFAGNSSTLTVLVTPGNFPPSTGLVVTADLTAIGGSAAQAFTPAAGNVFSFQAAVPASTVPGAKTLPVAISDAEGRSGSTTIALTVRPPLVAIHDIQGTNHLSPMTEQMVSTRGIVTARRAKGFYMQDPNPDANDATSEAIFVYIGSAPTVADGDAVLVTGMVKEYRASDVSLTITELDNPGRTVTVESQGNPLPPPVVIGTGGRIPPNTTIEDDAIGDVETSGVFDPASDGIDFWETLEDMLVQVNDAVAVGPGISYGEVPVVVDNGANAVVRSARGGVIATANDFNPERLFLDDEVLLFAGKAMPKANVGDHFPGAVVGIVDYSFNNVKLEVKDVPPLVSGGLAQETTVAAPPYQLAVGTFNVENLAPGDPPSKFSTLAGLIVNNLRAPDLLAIEEIQDNSGAADTGVVDASTTWSMLVGAIKTAGGPTYSYRQIDPVDKADGGAPAANIRVGFLFRTDRGLAFVARGGGDATTATAVTGSGSATQLTLSPGRVDPTNSAFTDSRKPLAGEFTFKGERVFAVANHFNSKGGDQPIFGRYQPPVFSSEIQRMEQAQVVKDFVLSLTAADPQANVVVMGDLNDFQFSKPLIRLKSAGLGDLIETLPVAEQYTYVYEGNSEVLDHIMVGNSTLSRPFFYDVVHVNSEFVNQASDHEPQVALLCVDKTAPTAKVTLDKTELWPANHKYVAVRSNVTVTDLGDPNPAWKLVSVTSNEPDNGLGDGDTPDDIVVVNGTTFQLRAERSGTGEGRVYTVTYRATDGCGNSSLATATVTVPHDKGNGK
jgi:predicted extracellular nuclease